MEYILVGIVIAVITTLTFKLHKTHPLEAGFSGVVTFVIVCLFSSVPIALLAILIAYAIFLALYYKAPPTSITTFLTTLKCNSHSKFRDL